LISVTGSRLHTQRLSGAGFTTPVDGDGWLGAVQGESRPTMVKPPNWRRGMEQRSPPVFLNRVLSDPSRSLINDPEAQG
jgi:hypothetical protein